MLLCAGWAAVNYTLYRCSFLPGSLQRDYFRVAACLPHLLSVANLGLVTESFRMCWFTQAEDLALDCFVHLLHFRDIAAFRICLTSMGGYCQSACTVEFRLTAYLLPWQWSVVFCRNYKWWANLSLCCNSTAPDPLLVLSFLSLNILHGCTFPLT